MSSRDHVDALNRVYGPETWDVYRELDVSLDPRGPDWLYTLAAEYLRPRDVVLDAGCRDAAHLVSLVEQNGVTGVGIDPVALSIERGRQRVEAAGLTDRVTLHCGLMQELPYPDQHFDFVWCREVLEVIDDLNGALSELVRVTKPTAHFLVFTIVATEQLDYRDIAMFERDPLGQGIRNLDESRLLAGFNRAGLSMKRREAIGTEWREYLEERRPLVSRKLLQLARLRRQRSKIIAEHGADIYAHIEANLHWELFQFLGKTVPIAYVLGRGGDATTRSGDRVT